MLFKCMFLKWKWFEHFDRRRYVIYGLDSEIYYIELHREMESSQHEPFVLP
jgi:hypothetical protein